MRQASDPSTGPALERPGQPAWTARGAGDSLEEAAFFSGAALARLDVVLAQEAVPQALLRQRLALRAAVASAALAGRRDSEGELRDALLLAPPGADPGPGGELLRQWQRAAGLPLRGGALSKALPAPLAGQGAQVLAGAKGPAVARAAAVLAAVLAEYPQQEPAALMLADAALARALGWPRMLPLLGLRLAHRDLRLCGGDLRLVCHRALAQAAAEALALAADLARRADALQVAAPRLRAKAAAPALALFLARDALTPAGLAHIMTDRAARRFCTRLADLGVLRELTGRASFRIYGV